MPSLTARVYEHSNPLAYYRCLLFASSFLPVVSLELLHSTWLSISSYRSSIADTRVKLKQEGYCHSLARGYWNGSSIYILPPPLGSVRAPKKFGMPDFYYEFIPIWKEGTQDRI